jgi:hypothetical protein
VRALRFTFQVDVFPSGGQEAQETGKRLRTLADYLEAIPSEVFTMLPTGGITGEVAWKCVWKVEERV